MKKKFWILQIQFWKAVSKLDGSKLLKRFRETQLERSCVTSWRHRCAEASRLGVTDALMGGGVH